MPSELDRLFKADSGGMLEMVFLGIPCLGTSSCNSCDIILLLQSLSLLVAFMCRLSVPGRGFALLFKVVLLHFNQTCLYFIKIISQNTVSSIPSGFQFPIFPVPSVRHPT